MALFHDSTAYSRMTQHAASKMLILTTALTLATMPTIGMAQPSWSQTNPGAQTNTPRPGAAALGKPLEVKCQPLINQHEEQPEFCRYIGGGEKVTPKALTSTDPTCQRVFRNGDEKTTCVIFRF
jgi:hypothetical protein